MTAKHEPHTTSTYWIRRRPPWQPHISHNCSEPTTEWYIKAWHSTAPLGLYKVSPHCWYHPYLLNPSPINDYFTCPITFGSGLLWVQGQQRVHGNLVLVLLHIWRCCAHRTMSTLNDKPSIIGAVPFLSWWGATEVTSSVISVTLKIAPQLFHVTMRSGAQFYLWGYFEEILI